MRRMKIFLRSVVLPVTLAVLLAMLCRPVYYKDNQLNILLMWTCIGVPFGISPRSELRKGDLLTNIVGASIGRTAVFDLHEKANINQAVCLIRLIKRALCEYLLLYMNSYTAYTIMMKDKVESARANISLTNISEFIIPLPPLAEQKRIVARLEELLPLCERLK